MGRPKIPYQIRDELDLNVLPISDEMGLDMIRRAQASGSCFVEVLINLSLLLPFIPVLMASTTSACSSQYWHNIMKAKQLGKTGEWHRIRAAGVVRKAQEEGSAALPLEVMLTHVLVGHR